MKICMLVTNPVTQDPRVRREAASLSRAGYLVEAIGLRGNEDSSEEWLDGCRIIRIPYPWAFYITLARSLILKISPAFYDSLRRWHRQRRVRRLTVDVPGSGHATPVRAQWWRIHAVLGALGKLRGDVTNIVILIWVNASLARAAMRRRAEVYHAHDLDTLLAGYLAARWTGGKLIYDFHELYTEQYRAGVKTVFWRRFHAFLERRLITRTDLRLTVCDSLGAWVAQRYGIHGVLTVMNAPNFQALPRVRVETKKDKVILYQGLYFRDRGLEQLIEGAQYLEGGRILFRGYGYLEENLRALVKQLKVEARVSFAPPVPMTDLVRAASEADIGVAPFVEACLNTRFCLPNKLFEYMMAGLAIAGSDLPEMRRVILGHQLGVLFNPDDPRAIAGALNELLRDEGRLEEMKRNAVHAARSCFNWEAESEKLVKAYHALTQQAGGAAT